MMTTDARISVRTGRHIPAWKMVWLVIDLPARSTMGQRRYRRAAGDVLNGCANAAAIASGSRRAPKGSNAWRRTSMVRRLPRIATTPMQSALPFRASRRSASGASGGTAFRANATSSIPTRRTTAGQAPMQVFATGSSTSIPGLCRRRCTAIRCPSSDIPCWTRRVCRQAVMPRSGTSMRTWTTSRGPNSWWRSRICWSVLLRALRGHRARLRSAACRGFGTSSPLLRPNGARWMSLSGWRVSTVGRSPGNFARHLAPAPAVSAPCGNWIMFGDC